MAEADPNLSDAHTQMPSLKGRKAVVTGGTHILGPHSTVYAGMKYGVAGFAEALRKELGNKDVKVGLVEPAKTGADFQLPEISVEKQREMINADKMLRAEDIAVGVHFMLTQPRRAVVQQLTIVQRVGDE